MFYCTGIYEMHVSTNALQCLLGSWDEPATALNPLVLAAILPSSDDSVVLELLGHSWPQSLPDGLHRSILLGDPAPGWHQWLAASCRAFLRLVQH